MFKSFLFLFFVTFSVAVNASVKVFVSPPGWKIPTGSDDEIKKYLESIDYDDSYIDPLSSLDVSKPLNKYRKLVEGEIQNIKGSGFCKIAVATGKDYYHKDTTPPTIFFDPSYADNNSDSCVFLYKKLKKKINGDVRFYYPQDIKEYGMLAIDMIFYFYDE